MEAPSRVTVTVTRHGQLAVCGLRGCRAPSNGARQGHGGPNRLGFSVICLHVGPRPPGRCSGHFRAQWVTHGREEEARLGAGSTLDPRGPCPNRGEGSPILWTSPAPLGPACSTRHGPRPSLWTGRVRLARSLPRLA